MENDKVEKLGINDRLSGNEPVHASDLSIVAQVVNQHAKYIEELIQRVKKLECEKKEAEDEDKKD